MVLRFFGDLGVNRDTIALCGYVSELEWWAEFNRRWEEVLREAGLKPKPGYFHMTDFNARRGVYRDWTQEKRVQVFDRLLEIITTTILAGAIPVGFGIAIGVVRADYDSLNEDDRWRLGRSLFALCASVLMGQVTRRLRDVGISEAVGYVFERGDEYSRELVREINAMHARSPRIRELILSIELADKRVFSGLQAADILAFETSRYVPVDLGFDDREPRHVIRNLVGQRPTRYIKRWFDQAALRALLAKKETREMRDQAEELFGLPLSRRVPGQRNVEDSGTEPYL